MLNLVNGEDFSQVKRRQDCESILGGKINQTYDGIGLEGEEEALRWMVRVAQEALSMIPEAWMSDKAAGPWEQHQLRQETQEEERLGGGERRMSLVWVHFHVFFNTHGALLRKHLDVHM